MILVANKKNFRPEIWLQAVLGFDHGEIIAGGDDAAVEHDKIVLARNENDFLRLAGAERESGNESEAAKKNLGATNTERKAHQRVIYGIYSTLPAPLGSITFHRMAFAFILLPAPAQHVTSGPP